MLDIPGFYNLFLCSPAENPPKSFPSPVEQICLTVSQLKICDELCQSWDALFARGRTTGPANRKALFSTLIKRSSELEMRTANTQKCISKFWHNDYFTLAKTFHRCHVYIPHIWMSCLFHTLRVYCQDSDSLPISVWPLPEQRSPTA